MLVVTTLHKRAVQEATALLGPHDGGKSWPLLHAFNPCGTCPNTLRGKRLTLSITNALGQSRTLLSMIYLIYLEPVPT